MSKKILITGGAGYIGSHTCVELQEKGFEVLIIDNLSNSREEVIHRIGEITGKKPGFIRLDLRNSKELNDCFDQHPDIAGVIHFAAYKAVGESAKDPLKYYQNNVISSINLLQAMQRKNCQSLVFSSSCTVYGQPDHLPVSENAPLKKALSPYGNTKRICEEIIQDQTEAESLQAISLRYFNPIGAHKSAKIGELPLGAPNNLVPYITQTAAGKRDTLKVFGKDYNTHDGTGIRDYIHVEDLAKAHVKAINRLIKSQNKEAFEIFNLGTGKGYSVLDIIKTFEKVTGVSVKHEITERRPGDIDKVWANPAKANNELDWTANNGLEEMLQSAWAWEQSLNDNNS